MRSVGAVHSLTLRTTYDGDYRGNRNWTDTPLNCALEGIDLASGQPVLQTKEYKYTQFSEPVVVDGILFHSSIAVMKEGKSGIWAYRLP